MGCLCGMLLAACANRADTAMKLIQQQQEEQAMLRQHEAEQERKNAPTKPELMRSMIREAQGQGRYFASLAYIDAYIAKFGHDGRIDAWRADALRLTGQTAQSEAAYRALLHTDQAPDAWHGLGLLAGARGDFSRAAEDLQRAAELSPTNALVLNDLGYARLRAGDVQGAALPLGKASELDSGNPKILANLALLLLVRGDAARADQVMVRAGLDAAARSEVYRLASEVPVRRPPQGSSAAVAQRAQDGVVRAVARSDGTSTDGVPAGDGFAMPLLQPRMEERFGNKPLAR